MGVYYSYEAGYGVAGTYNEPSELPGKLKGLDWEELQQLDLPDGLTLSLGGDMMCGPTRWALLIDACQISMDRDDFSVLQKLEGPGLEAAVLLSDTLSALELEPDFIGWHFFGNVS